MNTTADPPAEVVEQEIMRADVLEGFSLEQKELSPKYFYDTRGSELFEEITRLDEYYPTRTERGLLKRWMPEWVREERPAAFLELGAGSAEKSRIVLEAMRAEETGNLYVPVDVSADFLHETAHRLRDEYEGLHVVPEVADMTQPLDFTVETPSPTWYGLLGSTLGNFDPENATRLLTRVRGQLRESDRFLLGADLRPGAHKSVEQLEEAYNDAKGVTAAFNRNVLTVLNRELGTDFDLDAFHHRAFYDADEGRIEMHLVAEADQRVQLPGAGEIHVRAGESIRTEISSKYDRPSLTALFREAGLGIDRWVEDDRGFFALVLASPL